MVERHGQIANAVGLAQIERGSGHRQDLARRDFAWSDRGKIVGVDGQQMVGNVVPSLQVEIGMLRQVDRGWPVGPGVKGDFQPVVWPKRVAAADLHGSGKALITVGGNQAEGHMAVRMIDYVPDTGCEASLAPVQRCRSGFVAVQHMGVPRQRKLATADPVGIAPDQRTKIR